MSGVRRPLISIVTPTYNEALNVEECYLASSNRSSKRSLPINDYEAHLRRQRVARRDTGDTPPPGEGRCASQSSAQRAQFRPVPFELQRAALRKRGRRPRAAGGRSRSGLLELIPQFIARWREGHEVVYGIRAKRQESFTLRSIRR